MEARTKYRLCMPLCMPSLQEHSELERADTRMVAGAISDFQRAVRGDAGAHLIHRVRVGAQRDKHCHNVHLREILWTFTM